MSTSLDGLQNNLIDVNTQYEYVSRTKPLRVPSMSRSQQHSEICQFCQICQ